MPPWAGFVNECSHSTRGPNVREVYSDWGTRPNGSHGSDQDDAGLLCGPMRAGDRGLSPVLFGVEPLVHYAASWPGSQLHSAGGENHTRLLHRSLEPCRALLIGYSRAGLELTKEDMAHTSARRETVRSPPE